MHSPSHIPARRACRSGSTLIEAVVAISVMSGLAALSVNMILITMQQQQRLGEESYTTANLTRLAARFRQDVHAARGAEMTPDGVILSYRSGDPIRYRSMPTGVLRERDSSLLQDADVGDVQIQAGVLADQPVTQSRPLHRDLFALPAGTTVVFGTTAAPRELVADVPPADVPRADVAEVTEIAAMQRFLALNICLPSEAVVDSDESAVPTPSAANPYNVQAELDRDGRFQESLSPQSSR